MDPPLIEEYKVGPLPDVTSHSKIDSPAWKGNIPYRLRDFVAFIDFIALDEILKRELATAHDLLLQVTGHSYVSCTTNCLTFHAGYPGYTPSARKIIIVLTRQREGSFIHPIGLEVRVDTSNLDWRQWTVDQVWFRGQYFANIEDFVQRFDRSPFQNDFKPREYDPLDRNLFSALHFRGDPLPDEPPRRGPTCYMPDGRRFSVDRHRVTWQGWQFDVNMRTEISLQLHDIRFKGERVVYELGLSEIGVVYSGSSFAGMRSAFLDGGFALGPHTQELFPEIDCPTDAIYFDFAHFWGWGPVTFRRSACVFELNQGVPLRRFFVSNSQGGYHYVQGMTSNVLVLRGIITLGNYDYIMDYIFHQTGAVEVKATLNGYVFGTFFTQEQGNRFGFEIAPDTMGIIHNHLIQYKVDVDVLGTENRFETLNITMEPVADVVDNLVDYQLQVFQRSLKRTEMEAAIRYNFDNPKYYLMGNANYNNSYGNQRSYRILPVNMGKNILPEGWKIEKGFAWARYQLAITRHSDIEERGSAPYNNADLVNPIQSFQDFIDDDQSIVDQDLVAWVTLGTFHVPHSEDVPIVTSPGVQLHFFLLPFNYFDEDPSLASRDNIRATPNQDGDPVFEYAGVQEDLICVPRDVTAGGCRASTGVVVAPSTVSLLLSTALVLAVYNNA